MDKNMAKKKEDILNKFDPALVKAAVMELAGNVKKIDKKDVEKAKEQLKEIYKSIPETKDGMQILATALDEFNSEIIVEEIEKVKTELKDFSRTELMELNKELLPTLPGPCPISSIICPTCIKYLVWCPSKIGCTECVRFYICVKCMSLICTLCMHHSIICSRCVQHIICTQYTVCAKCVGWSLRIDCPDDLALDCGPGMRFPDIPELGEMLINNPVWTEQLVDALLKNPKLSRALRKLVTDMKIKGEI